MSVVANLMFVLTLTSLFLLGYTQVSVATCLKPKDKDNSSCLECRDHYHLYEGNCYINIMGCEEYVFGNICRKCASGYILVNNECCDRNCMSKVYLKLQNSIENQHNQQEAIRKAEIEGYEKSVSLVARTSIKQGQTYEILTTKSQFFNSIYRYQVRINIEGKVHVALLDYNIETKQPTLVQLSLEGQLAQPEVSLNEDNIHGNEIYEKGYKYIYMKYGLELYELEFLRLTAINYGRSTELKFIFVGSSKVLLITIVVNEQETYTLWKEEKTNVDEIKQHIETLKKVESVSKEYNFQQVFLEVLKQKHVTQADAEIIEVTAISKEEYLFVIYIKSLKTRYVTKGSFNPKTKSVNIKKIEEVFHPKLQEIKEPEKPQIKIVTKENIGSSTDAKEVFDYLYKVRPSFRQTQVEAIQVEQTEEIKKITIIEKKDGKDYRVVILKEEKSQEMQLIDESEIVTTKPQAIVVQQNNDGTKTITTNHIDYTQTEVKSIVHSLKQVNIDTTTTNIASIRTTEGPKSTEYLVVLSDTHGNPTKQVVLTQDRATEKTTVVDVITIESQINYVKPVVNTVTVIPVTQFYKPEIKELVTKIEQSEQHVTISKIHKITVVNSTQANRYQLTVENSKGEEVKVTVLQDNGDKSVSVINVQPTVQAVTASEHVQITTTKSVTSYGVQVEYTNDRETLATDQNVNVALTTITSTEPALQEYKVVSSYTKSYTQHQEQTLILSNGQKSVQVTGNIDLKTLRYVTVEKKQVATTMSYPVITQNTIPASIYPTIVKENRSVKDSEQILVEKFKMFKNKIPTLTTVESFEIIDKVTFNYDVNEKKFVAVVAYNKTDKASSKIIEVTPVQDNVVAVSVEQTIVNGETITKSNSITEITQVNQNTNAVLTKVTTQFPLLKKAEIVDVQVVSSTLSDVFAITYKDATSSVETTFTVRSDKTASTITVEDITTTNSNIENSIIAVQPVIITISSSEYQSSTIRQIITTIESSNVKVDKINSITAEVWPTYITYTLVVLSSNKPFEITVMEKNGVREVLAIHSQAQETSSVTQSTTKKVDNNGNKITVTSDVKIIEKSEVAQNSLSIIQQQFNQYKNYHIESLQITDIGKTNQVDLVLRSEVSSEKMVQTTLFYDETSKQVKIVAVEPIKGIRDVSAPIYIPQPHGPTTVILSSSVTSTIQTNIDFKSVLTQIQQAKTEYVQAIPESTTVEPISETITKYTSVVVVENRKDQIVAIYDKSTKTSSVVSVSTIPANTTAFYLTEIQTETGEIITSNSPTEIAQLYPEFTQVLEFSNTWLKLQDWNDIISIEVNPSEESNTYTIAGNSNGETVTIIVNYDISSKVVTVIDFISSTQEPIYPVEEESVELTVEQNKEEIESYVTLIESSDLIEYDFESVEEVVSVSKETSTYSDKIYMEVLDTKGEKHFVTLIKEGDKKPHVVSIEKEMQVAVIEEYIHIEEVDFNGNKVVETTKTSDIEKNVEVQTSFKQIVATHTEYKDWKVEYAQTIDYGTTKQIVVSLTGPKPTDISVHTIVIYNEETKTASIVSLQPIQGIRPSEPTIHYPSIPHYPTTVIPAVAVAETIKTDIGFSTVLTKIQQTHTIYSKVVPSTSEIQVLSPEATKYTLTMVVDNKKQQAVYLYNQTSKITTEVAFSSIPSNVESTYVKQASTSSGNIIYVSNSVTAVTAKFQDFTEVIKTVLSSLPGIETSDIMEITVAPQATVNSYTLKIAEGLTTSELTINYDIVKKQTYIVDYKQESINIEVSNNKEPLIQVISTDEKIDYLTFIKSIKNVFASVPINIIKVQTIQNVQYKEIHLLVETMSFNYFVKLIKKSGEDSLQFVDATVIRTGDEGSTSVTEGSVGTVDQIGNQGISVTTDSNGNTITEITDVHIIKKSEIVTTTYSTVVKTYKELENYQVVRIHTQDIGTTQVSTLTLVGPKSTDSPVQTTIIYDQTTKTGKVVAMEPIKGIQPHSPIYGPIVTPRHVTPTTLIPENEIKEVVKTNVELKDIITQIKLIKSEYETATFVSVEERQISQKSIQFTVVLQVTKDRRDQIIVIYDRTTSKSSIVSVTTIPKDIKSVVLQETKTAEQTIIITNTYEQVKTTHPQTTVVVDKLLKDVPSITVKNIESYVVIPESQSTTVALVVKSTGQSYTYNQYVTTEDKSVTKVDEQVISIMDITSPKPIKTVTVNPQTVLAIPQIKNELIKIMSADTTTTIESRIISIEQSSKTNVHVYNVHTVDNQNRNVVVEIFYNPTTTKANVIDISEIGKTPAFITETVVREVTGKTEVTTNNTQTIKETKEYKKIVDYINKNHGGEGFVLGEPVLDVSEKYQRSSIKTLVYEQNKQVVQGTYIIDQRTNTIIEVHYSTTTKTTESSELPVDIPTIVYSPSNIPIAIKSNPILAIIIEMIVKMDFSLADIIPVYVEVKSYTSWSTATIVYETPASNSRILAVYNLKTKEAKIVDYTKVPKIIETSRTVEGSNSIGQKIVYTTNVASLQSTSEEFSTVFASVVNVIPSINVQNVKGVETIVKQTGKEYKIITIENGIIGQVVVQSDNTTSKVVVVSKTETTIASEIMSIVKTNEPAKTKLSVESLTSTDINAIKTELVTSNIKDFAQNSEIISGTVTENEISKSYELVVRNIHDFITTVRVVKNKVTNKITVNNVQNIAPKQVAPTIKTVVKQDVYGNIETITNNVTEIITTEETEIIIQTIIKKKPSLRRANPVYVQTKTYQDIEESVYILAIEGQSPVQVTSFKNIKTGSIDVIDIKTITVDKTITSITQITPVSNIQTIPTAAIPVAAKKYPEINDVIKSVQSKTTKEAVIKTLIIEDLENVKKIVAIVTVSQADQQFIYLYEKTTKILKFIQSSVIPSNIKPLIHEQSTNSNGESITTSTSIERITTQIPVVTNAIQSVTTKYTSVVKEQIKSIQVKGNDVKEIKFVTQENPKASEVVYTVLASQTEVTVIDVQQVSILPVSNAPVEKPTPITGIRPVKPEEKKVIQDTITSSSEITSTFTGVTVNEIISTSTAFTTSYSVKITDKNNKSASVTLIQQPGQNIQITSVHSDVVHENKTETKKTTEVTVSTVTGNTVTVTNDISFIKQDKSITTVTSNIIQQKPELVHHVPVSTKVTTYGDIQETVVVMVSGQQTPVQVTSLLNVKTEIVQIIETKTIEKTETTITSEVKPVSYVQTIPAPALPVASKKMPELVKILAQVQDLTSRTGQVEVVTVEEFTDSKKYTVVAISTDGKQQFVFLFIKQSKEIKFIQRVTIAKNIEPVTFEQTTNKFGEIVTVSNNVQYISAKNPSVTEVMSSIESSFKGVTSSTKSIQIKESKESTEYKVVVEVNHKIEQITAVKQNNVISVLGIQVAPQIVENKLTVTSEKASVKETTSVKITEETKKTIQNIINNSNIPQIVNGEIVKIESTETLLSIVYTVQVKSTSSKIEIVTIVSQYGEKPKITSVKQVKPSVVTVSEQTITTRQTDITGSTYVVTTDKKAITKDKNIKIVTDEIIKSIPILENYQPSSIKSVSYGNTVEQTIVFVSEDKTTVQVTSLLDSMTGVVQVVDQKHISVVTPQHVTMPTSFVHTIPAAAIAATAKVTPELDEILRAIQKLYTKTVQFESVIVEDFETKKKYTVLVSGTVTRTKFVYFYDRTTKKSTLIETINIPLVVEALHYQETVNRYGEKTIVSNSVSEIVTTVPVISGGIEYVKTKYPAVTTDSITLVKTVEYPNHVQVTTVFETAKSEETTIVVNVHKTTKQVTDVTTFSVQDQPRNPADVAAPVYIQSRPTTHISVESSTVSEIVKTIEKSTKVPVNNIETVLSATLTETSFGSEIITLEALATDQTKIKTTVNYNPSTKIISIGDYQILENPVAHKEVITDFKIDTLTGTKTTTTNDLNVLASSEIISSLLVEIKRSYPELSQQTLTSSTTVEYPDKVKVISIFTKSTTQETTQVVSIFDKTTGSIKIIEVSKLTVAAPVPTIPRQIYTSSEIIQASSSTVSISSTTSFIQTNVPALKNEIPSTVIVESLANTEFVSYIYETETTSSQVVVMYDKTSGVSTILENNPISENIQPFFYEEKKNVEGEKIVLSNSLTEVVQRLPKTEVLEKHFKEQLKTVDINKIKTVETVVGSVYNDYTVVVETKEGMQQYEFVLNTQTNQIKQIGVQTLPAVSIIPEPQETITTTIEVSSSEIKSFITSIIDNPSTNLNDVQSIVSIQKPHSSHVERYEIEYVTKENTVNKLLVQKPKEGAPIIVDERPINPKFIVSSPIFVQEHINDVTKASTIVYPNQQTFILDSKSKDITSYVSRTVSETESYTIESVRKVSYGQIDQYDILYKSENKAPIQISVVNDKNSQNIILLENKKITEPVQKSVLDGSAPQAVSVEVSDIEKENIKVLSKLGLVKDIKQYNQVTLDVLASNDQFVLATQAVKESYPVLLKESVIIKVLEKKSLESDSVKVFFKAKDQIYEASIEMNPITKETKLTDFIKIGSQTSAKSEVNVYADLCYGYQKVEDFSTDSNLDFLTDYLKKKYESLRSASLTEAQSIVLENGRINYKLYFKKDAQTVKYIVYFEPEYKRVMEVKGTSFSIGDKFANIPREKQVNDPYFRKLDTYIRQNRNKLNSASVLHTESKEDGKTIEFRTVYTAEGKTFRSVASINKDNQNIDESAFNEVIEIPTEESLVDIGENDESLQLTKLDLHDIGKNLYFTEAHRFIQSKYQKELNNAQLLGASEKANLFSYAFKEFYMVDGKIITVSAEYNPLTQSSSIIAELEIIDIHEGYFPVKSDKKLTEVRNWLKEKNLDLSSAVMISSMSKPILFGVAYKIIFKDLTKYFTYVVYVDSITREMRILDESASNQLNPTQVSSEGKESTTQFEPKLKGFARPQTKVLTSSAAEST